MSTRNTTFNLSFSAPAGAPAPGKPGALGAVVGPEADTLASRIFDLGLEMCTYDCQRLIDAHAFEGRDTELPADEEGLRRFVFRYASVRPGMFW